MYMCGPVCLSASPTSGPIVAEFATHVFATALKVVATIARHAEDEDVDVAVGAGLRRHR